MFKPLNIVKNISESDYSSKEGYENDNSEVGNGGEFKLAEVKGNHLASVSEFHQLNFARSSYFQILLNCKFNK